MGSGAAQENDAGQAGGLAWLCSVAGVGSSGSSQANSCCSASTLPLPLPPNSCLGAEADAPSRRLRTKHAGEEVVRSELGPISTIFKPAVCTGTEDRLFNMYASMAKRTPAMPLIDGGKTRLQPVWVRDVAAGARVGGGRLSRWVGCLLRCVACGPGSLREQPQDVPPCLTLNPSPASSSPLLS